MKTLVTGASGILGSALLGRWGSAALGVSRKAVPGMLQADLSRPEDVDKIFERGPFDLVVNPAAWSDVDGCERDPSQAWASNAESVKNLAAACEKAGTPLLHVSTNYVFDGRKGEPYAEGDETSPVNIYGLTKLAGEHFALSAKVPTAIVRTSWLFGPGNPQNFVTVVLGRLKKEDLVRVLDDQTDAPTHVGDLAAALEKVAGALRDAKKAGKAYREIFQVCNAGTATRLEMARALKDAIGSAAKVERLDAAELKGRLAIRPAYGAMSPAKYEKAFGGRMRPWREALKEYAGQAA